MPFWSPIIKQINDDEIVSERKLKLVNQSNELKMLVESENWIRGWVVWQRMEAKIL